MSTKSRYLLALGEGVLVHAFIFHPFVPYSMREQTVPNFWVIVILLLIAGFAATYRRGEHVLKLCPLVVLGMFAANALLIAFDWMKDPTTHNLFPFEFIMIGSAIVPVFIGGFIAVRLTGTSTSS